MMGILLVCWKRAQCGRIEIKGHCLPLPLFHEMVVQEKRCIIAEVKGLNWQERSKHWERKDEKRRGEGKGGKGIQEEEKKSQRNDNVTHQITNLQLMVP